MTMRERERERERRERERESARRRQIANEEYTSYSETDPLKIKNDKGSRQLRHKVKARRAYKATRLRLTILLSRVWGRILKFVVIENDWIEGFTKLRVQTTWKCSCSLLKDLAKSSVRMEKSNLYGIL